MSIEDKILEILSDYNSIDKGKISLLLQPVIAELVDGKDIGSVRKLAEELGISKSSLSRILLSIKP